MNTSASFSSCRILIYGRDEVLLQTRSSLLETAGFKSDTTLNGEEFARRISAEQRRYCIFIVCHSIERGEVQAIVEAAKASGVHVYALSSMTMPDEFLGEVRRLVDQCSLASTLVSA